MTIYNNIVTVSISSSIIIISCIIVIKNGVRKAPSLSWLGPVKIAEGMISPRGHY